MPSDPAESPAFALATPFDLCEVLAAVCELEALAGARPAVTSADLAIRAITALADRAVVLAGLNDIDTNAKATRSAASFHGADRKWLELSSGNGRLGAGHGSDPSCDSGPGRLPPRRGRFYCCTCSILPLCV